MTDQKEAGMAGEGKEKKSKTKAKTDHELTTTDGGTTSRSTLSKLSSTVSNNKKTLTLAGAAAAGVAAAAGRSASTSVVPRWRTEPTSRLTAGGTPTWSSRPSGSDRPTCERAG